MNEHDRAVSEDGAADQERPAHVRPSIPWAIAATVLALVPLALLALPFAGAGLIAATVITVAVGLAIVAVVRSVGGARGRGMAVVALAVAVTTGTASGAIGLVGSVVVAADDITEAVSGAPLDLVDVLAGESLSVAEPALISGQWVVDELLRACGAGHLHAVATVENPALFLVGSRPVSVDAFAFTVTVEPGTDTWSAAAEGEVPAGVRVRTADEVNPLGCSEIEIDAVTGEPVSDVVDSSTGGVGSPPLAEGEVAFADLEVGMCVNDAGISESVFGLPVVDCAEPHDSEIYAIFDLPAGAYPGDDEVMSASDEGCFAAFEPYVAVPYDQSVLYFLYYWPDKRSWGIDDRAVVCILYDPDAPLVGSARDSGR